MCLCIIALQVACLKRLTFIYLVGGFGLSFLGSLQRLRTVLSMELSKKLELCLINSFIFNNCDRDIERL